MADTALSKAARVLSKVGASKGGKARSAKMTAAQRSAAATKAIETRWRRQRGEQDLPRRPQMEPEEIGAVLFKPQGAHVSLTISAGEDQTRWSVAEAHDAVAWLRRWIAGQQQG